MAERWQQWMPHDVDSWQGSANIQALSDLAYRAVHNLLMDMWKQDDCALPLDDRELAKRSRIMQRWAECRDEVLEYFTDRTDAGKITHRVLFRKWSEAREVYEKRQAAAKKTNATRTTNGDRDGDRSGDRNESATLEPRSADTGTRTSTGTEEKQKPSRGKREADPRHVPFKQAVEAYANHKQVLFVWDAAAAKQLDALLKSAPALTLEGFRNCLRHRARSPGVPHGQHPRAWLLKILEYQEGPLNQYGRTGDAGGVIKGKTEHSINAAQQAIDGFADRARKLEERARALEEGGGDLSDAEQAGYPPASEVGSGRLLGAGR